MRGFSWSHGAERKDSFVKCDMMRNDNFVGVQVKAPISAMNVRVPEKDRWCGTRSKFMRWKGVRVTKASKRAKIGVRDTHVNILSEAPAILEPGIKMQSADHKCEDQKWLVEVMMIRGGGGISGNLLSLHSHSSLFLVTMGKVGDVRRWWVGLVVETVLCSDGGGEAVLGSDGGGKA
ncbi:hypothetical protein Tco_0512373 [Tanacetum coccineum]